MDTREFVEQSLARGDLVSLRVVRARCLEGERTQPIDKGTPLVGGVDDVLRAIEDAQHGAKGTDVKLELRASFKTAPTEALPL